jgi:hypothetical protein
MDKFIDIDRLQCYDVVSKRVPAFTVVSTGPRLGRKWRRRRFLKRSRRCQSSVVFEMVCNFGIIDKGVSDG